MIDPGEQQRRNGAMQELTEGGHQPALGVQSDDHNGELPMGSEESLRPAVNLPSFRGFLREMVDRCLCGSVSREDALSMIVSVADYRKLNEIFGTDEVSELITKEFISVVDYPTSAQETVTALFPGMITADQLQTAQFPPPVFVVPGFIAEGVTLLAGKPKLGKSWLMLDLAVGVATGKSVLGNRPVLPGQVLGLFLEDSKRRLQTRLRKLETSPGEKWSSDLSLATHWPRMDEGGLADLQDWCRQAQTPRLIIIDTLAKLRPSQASKKTQYDLDYEVLSGLHKIAHEFQVAIIVVHHTRKQDADDVFDTVSGTLGLTGAADSILVLSKKSGKAVLHAKGRDIEDAEIVLAFDAPSCRWIAVGDPSDVLVTDERARVLSALEKASEPMSPAELMLLTGIKSRNAIDLLLLKMLREGQIGKVSRGKYVDRGKIGKKEPAPTQAPEVMTKSAGPPDLSDLSAKEAPGDAANERTTP